MADMRNMFRDPRMLGLLVSGMGSTMTGDPRHLNNSVGLMGAFEDLNAQREALKERAQRREMMRKLRAAAPSLLGAAPEKREELGLLFEAMPDEILTGLLSERAFAPPAPARRMAINNRLVDPDTGAVIADLSDGDQKRGASRVVERGTEKMTEEWDGAQWRVIGRSPLFKPSEATDALTPAQRALDTKFGEQWADLVMGGSAVMRKNAALVRGGIEELKKDPGLTGPVTGSLPDAVRTFTNPKSVALQERLLSAIQENMRNVLGAAFTAKEGEAFLSRSFNPKLPAAENIRRLELLSAQMDEALAAKMDAGEYFEERGTLKGYQGSLYNSLDDFEGAFSAAIGEEKGAAGASGTWSDEPSLDALLDKYAPRK